MEYYIGVDFGTTNSCVYLAKDGKEPKSRISTKEKYIPSIICEKRGNKELGWYYGEEASQKIDEDVMIFSNLKLSFRSKAEKGTLESKTGWQAYYNGKALSGEKYKIDKLTKEFLRYLFEIADIAIGEDKDSVSFAPRECAALQNVKVIMGHPVFKDIEQRDAYRKKFKNFLVEIGFLKEKIEFEEEPCLAAYGLAKSEDVQQGDRILIFDCGGGTTDVSVLEKVNDNRYRTVACKSCNYAGVAIDKALFRYLREKSGNNINAGNASKAFEGRIKGISLKSLIKIKELKEHYCDVASQSIETKSLEDLGISPVECTFNDFYESKYWKRVIKKILEPLNDIISMADPKNTGHDIKKVFLSGGSSMMPIFSDIIKNIIDEHKRSDYE